MRVIAEIKLTTVDGRQILNDRKLFESTTNFTTLDDEELRVETLDLRFKWINNFGGNEQCMTR